MASILYRKGDTHIVDGVKCEVAKFDGSEVAAAFEQGWVAELSQLNPVSEKDELEAIARQYGVELDKRKSLASLQKQVQELINGDKGRSDQ